MLHEKRFSGGQLNRSREAPRTPPSGGQIGSTPMFAAVNLDIWPGRGFHPAPMPIGATISKPGILAVKMLHLHVCSYLGLSKGMTGHGCG